MIAEALFVATLLHTPPLVEAPAQTEIVQSFNLTVVDGPSIWKRIGRRAAWAVSLGAVSGATQPSNDSIKKDTPFKVSSTHDGIDTDSYAVLLNSALSAMQPLSALRNGVILFDYPNGLPKGSYMVVVKAIGPGGETASPALALSVTGANPSAPGQPSIIKGGGQ